MAPSKLDVEVMRRRRDDDPVLATRLGGSRQCPADRRSSTTPMLRTESSKKLLSFAALELSLSPKRRRPSPAYPNRTRSSHPHQQPALNHHYPYSSSSYISSSSGSNSSHSKPSPCRQKIRQKILLTDESLSIDTGIQARNSISINNRGGHGSCRSHNSKSTTSSTTNATATNSQASHTVATKPTTIITHSVQTSCSSHQSAERRQRFMQQRVENMRARARGTPSTIHILPESATTATPLSLASSSSSDFVTPRNRVTELKESAAKGRASLSYQSATTSTTTTATMPNRSLSDKAAHRLLRDNRTQRTPPLAPSPKPTASTATMPTTENDASETSTAASKSKGKKVIEQKRKQQNNGGSISTTTPTTKHTTPTQTDSEPFRSRIVTRKPLSPPPRKPRVVRPVAPKTEVRNPLSPRNGKTGNSASRATTRAMNNPKNNGGSTHKSASASKIGSTNNGTRTETPRLTTLATNNTSTPGDSKDSITPKESTNKDPDTRRNLDKRTARLKYGDAFANEIDRCKQKNDGTSPLVKGTTTPTSVGKAEPTAIRVYVRKRPIFAPQVQAGDFDVVHVITDPKPSVSSSSSSSSIDNHSASAAVVVYRTTLAADMKTKLVQPVGVSHGLTNAFDETIGNAEVYHTVVRPMVESVLRDRMAATLLMFGQTGSGKTYTISACQKLAVAELFASPDVRQVQVQCLELVGKRCRDLLGSGDTAKNVKIGDNPDGSVTFVGAYTTLVDSSRDLLSILEQSQGRRATQSTEQNDTSSRSHAIFQIRTMCNKSNERSGGVLTLLDLAGTERKNDSLYHSKERQAESTEINASLYALKECIRVRSENRTRNLRVPYRSSNLTRILRESLEHVDTHLAVIATVAPNATDTEHTIQTLKTVAKLTGATWEEAGTQKVESPPGLRPGEPETIVVAPKKWSHSDLVAWLATKEMLGSSPIPLHLDGKRVMRMSKIQLRNAFYNEDISAEDRTISTQKADALFRSLRVETDLASRIDLKRRMSVARLST